MRKTYLDNLNNTRSRLIIVDFLMPVPSRDLMRRLNKTSNAIVRHFVRFHSSTSPSESVISLIPLNTPISRSHQSNDRDWHRVYSHQQRQSFFVYTGWWHWKILLAKPVLRCLFIERRTISIVSTVFQVNVQERSPYIRIRFDFSIVSMVVFF